MNKSGQRGVLHGMMRRLSRPNGMVVPVFATSMSTESSRVAVASSRPIMEHKTKRNARAHSRRFFKLLLCDAVGLHK